jgi:hypothetical protein
MYIEFWAIQVKSTIHIPDFSSTTTMISLELQTKFNIMQYHAMKREPIPCEPVFLE